MTEIPEQNMDPRQIALGLVQSNPNIANTPQGQRFIQILQSGDNKAGEEMAMNICNSYGMSPQDALMKAANYFKNR